MLAQRRRLKNGGLVAVLVFLNRLAAFVVTVLAFPVLRLLVFSRR